MNWLLVACGGAIGASLRYGVSLFIIPSYAGFPWATWIINIVGCLFAGIFFAMSMKYSVLQNEARLFLMVGILGGFTTFSSFGLDNFQLLRDDQIMLAGLYVISSLIIGILVLGIGYYITHWIMISAK